MIEELPTLIDAAMSIFMNVISEFVLGRKVLVGRITKELLSLMDVSKSYKKVSFSKNYLSCSDLFSDIEKLIAVISHKKPDL